MFEKVVEHLRAAILDGGYRQGDRLPAERELVRQFQVGRGAIREALRVLEQGGLIRIRPGKGGGAFVEMRNTKAVTRSLSDLLRFGEFTLEQVTEVRLGLEALIVDTLAAKPPKTALRRILESIDRATADFKAGNLVASSRANFEFHVQLAEATGNPVYPLLIRALLDIFEPMLTKVGSSRRLSTATHTSHRTILNHLLTGNGRAAKRELRRHIIEVQQLLRGTARRRSWRT
ncbi:MAG TPA: FCD domain-containing protein [Candidatus Binatia bacterium]|nr:FCD domain-containing protein [Candidatus Binatia bacterium]